MRPNVCIKKQVPTALETPVNFNSVNIIWLIDWLIDNLIDWLIDCLIDCLIIWLIYEWIDWLIVLLIHLFIKYSAEFVGTAAGKQRQQIFSPGLPSGGLMDGLIDWLPSFFSWLVFWIDFFKGWIEWLRNYWLFEWFDGLIDSVDCLSYWYIKWLMEQLLDWPMLDGRIEGYMNSCRVGLVFDWFGT